MNINDILLAAREAPADSVFIPEKWGQGRATFGGLVAAVMLERIHVHVGAEAGRAARFSASAGLICLPRRIFQHIRQKRR